MVHQDEGPADRRWRMGTSLLMFAVTHSGVPFMRLSALSAAILALSVSAALPADAAGLNAASAAHRAFYTLTLSSSRGGNVVAARGTMGYEVIDACDGWAVRQRLSMTLTNSEGQDIEMVSDYATWEEKDDLKFRFHMKQTTDTAVTSQTDGDAKLERAAVRRGALHRSRGQHKAASVRHAVPDGAYLGDPRGGAVRQEVPGALRCSTAPTIWGRRTAPSWLDWKKPEANKYPFLAALPSTRVRLAFFDDALKGEVPTYQVGMRYWENGVADNLQMDFGDFVMDAKLTDLTQLPHKC